MKKKLLSIGLIAATPSLINAFGWGAVLIGVGGIISLIILIVKQLKGK